MFCKDWNDLNVYRTVYTVNLTSRLFESLRKTEYKKKIIPLSY